MTSIWALGLMSGTSLDGIDAALLRTNGEVLEAFGPSLTLPYAKALREQLRGLMAGDGDWLAVEKEMTEAHAEAVARVLAKAGMSAADVGVIGFHGQTLAHRPAEGITWQIGNGALLAERTGIDVVCDFRRRDVAAGGQGAPLVPVFHLAVAREKALPLAIVNIGGISNITYIGGHSPDEVMAFDSGPGNTLLDRWVQRQTGHNQDDDGRLGLMGTVNEACLQRLMDHPFIVQQPPKSFDVRDFTLAIIEGLSTEDGAATLAAFTADAIALNARFLPKAPLAWLIAGGGAHNVAMMNRLRAKLPNVQPASDAGWSIDALEAQAFAYLAVRSLHGLPISYPKTTGVSSAATGGAFYRAARGVH